MNAYQTTIQIPQKCHFQKSPFFLLDCLKYHNKFRENHEDTPAMEWDETIAKGAEEYAKKLAETEEFKHSERKDRNDAGENLAYRSGKFDNNACEFAVATWYVQF